MATRERRGGGEGRQRARVTPPELPLRERRGGRDDMGATNELPLRTLSLCPYYLWFASGNTVGIYKQHAPTHDRPDIPCPLLLFIAYTVYMYMYKNRTYRQSTSSFYTATYTGIKHLGFHAGAQHRLELSGGSIWTSMHGVASVPHALSLARGARDGSCW